MLVKMWRNGISHTLAGDVKRPLWGSLTVSKPRTKRTTHLRITFLGIYPREMRMCVCTKTCAWAAQQPQ